MFSAVAGDRKGINSASVGITYLLHSPVPPHLRLSENDMVGWCSRECENVLVCPLRMNRFRINGDGKSREGQRLTQVHLEGRPLNCCVCV